MIGKLIALGLVGALIGYSSNVLAIHLMFEDNIMAFDLIKLETVIMKSVHRELRHIEVLGGILGLLIGLLQGIIVLTI